MPFKSVDEAVKKHPGLANYSEKARRGWFKSINKCFEGGGEDSKCFPIAWSVANKVDGKKPKSKKSTLTQPLRTRRDYGEVRDMEREAVSLEEMKANLMVTAAKKAEEDEDEKEARFEKGKPADPTKNMSPEDKAKWKSQKEKNKDKFKKARRQRITAKVAAKQQKEALDAEWARLDEAFNAPSTKEAAISPAGLYGYTKAVQADCETAARKLLKSAAKTAKAIYAKDERVAEFLSTHAKRGKSASARILVAAMKEIGPKVASEGKEACGCAGDDSPCTCKTAGYSMYGFRTKTAQLGLQACSDIRTEAGRIASALHRRRAALHEKITGFFREHSKTAKCAASRMILDCYPDATLKFGSEKPQSVEEILSWEG